MWDYSGYMLISWLIWVIPLIIYYVIGIFCAIWVYNDAKKRRGMPQLIWMFVVILTGIVGIIIYLVIREQ